jgi:S1-C subfamily serine protease
MAKTKIPDGRRGRAVRVRAQVLIVALAAALAGAPAQAENWQAVEDASATGRFSLDTDSVAMAGGFRTVIGKLEYPVARRAANGSYFDLILHKLAVDCARKRFAYISSTSFNGTKQVSSGTFSEAEWRYNLREIPVGDRYMARMIDSICTAAVAQSGGENEAPAPGRPAEGNRQSSGSGIAVSRDGVVLTNYHVVENCRRISVRDANRVEMEGIVRAKDVRNDLAILRTNHVFRAVAPFRGSAVVAKLGESVVAVGFPLTGLLASEPNVSFGNISATAGLMDDYSKMQISTPVQPGNSGGPLLDQNGSVVGVIQGKLNSIAVARVTGDIPQNINFAVKGEIAQIFMRANDVSFSLADNAKKLTTEEIAAKGRQIAVFVSCEGDAGAARPGTATPAPPPARATVESSPPPVVSRSAPTTTPAAPEVKRASPPPAGSATSMDDLKDLLPAR